MKIFQYLILFILFFGNSLSTNAQDLQKLKYPEEILHKSYKIQAHCIDSIQILLNKYDFKSALSKYRELENWAIGMNDFPLKYAFQLREYYLYLDKNNLNPKFVSELSTLLKTLEDGNLYQLKAEALELLGRYYDDILKNKASAIENFQYSYDIYKNLSTNDFPRKIVNLYELAGKYYFYRDFETAKKYYLEAWKSDPSEKNKYCITILNTIGLCYSHLEIIDSSNIFFQKALDFALINNDEIWVGIISGNLGTNYFKEKKYDLANPMFLKNIELSKKHNQKSELAEYLSKFGTLLLIQKDYKGALEYQLKSLEIVNKKKFSFTLTYIIYLNVASAFAANGNFKMAYLYLDSAYKTKEIFEKERNSITLAGVQLKMQLEKQRSDIEKKEDELQKQKLYRNFFIFCFLLLLIASLIFLFQQKKYKKAQIKLFLSEKLAALGQVSAGVAHEVNTPLGAIKSSAEESLISFPELLSEFKWFNQELIDEDKNLFVKLLSQSNLNNKPLTTKEERDIKKNIADILSDMGIENSRFLAGKLVQVGIYEITPTIEKLSKNKNFEKMLLFGYNILNQQRNSLTIKLAVDKASRIVNALKSFLHTSSNVEMEPINLQDNLETVLTIYNNRLKQGIQVVKNYEKVPEILGFPDQLNQVWTNLIVNAVQAMDNKGTLTISIKNETSFVNVSIKDTGKGIPKKIQKKIFDPFFTTKGSGEGTGIGLDITKKIIKDHFAKIWFETKEGEGTTFFVEIPIRNT